MQAFPFTPEEWDIITEHGRAVCNATLADDPQVRERSFVELSASLQALREKYGEHPVLWETEADFELDRERSIELYLRAVDLADLEGLPTLSIRISLARELLEQDPRSAEAQRHLAACEDEARASPDASERDEWLELRQRA